MMAGVVRDRQRAPRGEPRREPHVRPLLARLLPAALALAAGCRGAPAGDAGPGAVAGAVASAAARELFTVREHDRRLVVWSDAALAGPVLGALGVAPHAAPPLSVAVPVTTLDAADLDRLFREHPDGWAAFFDAFAGAGGLVEVAPPRLDPGGRRATVLVGRSCGEHCRQAWRVTLARGAGDGWRVVAVAPVGEPGAAAGAPRARETVALPRR